MSFSGKSHSILYFIVIFAILSYALDVLPSFSGVDQIRTDVSTVFGQLDDGQKVKNEVSPNTTINSAIDVNNNVIANNGSTTSNSMKFAFSGTDNEGMTINHFDCSIDGRPFVTCVSTNTVNVAGGTHSFNVRSNDNAGNKDLTPASFTWMVNTVNSESSNTQIGSATDGNKMPIVNGSNTTTPTTSIISAIDGNNNTISNNGISKSTSIRFTLSGTDIGGVGVDHLQCNIDNSKYVPCTSPFIFSNLLKDGTHTFKVRAQDSVGNKSSSPASFTWNVDTLSPTTSINAAIDGNKTNVANGTNTNSNSMSFEFSGNDTGGSEGKGAGINHFECNIDNSKYVPCTSPFIFSDLLKDGTHTFTVMSDDNAGNKDLTPASFTWTVDTLAPHISINTATDGNGKFMTTGGNTSSNSATLVFSGNDTGGNEGKGVGIKQFECSLDGASFSICSSPVQFTSVDLAEGTHTFQIIAEDNTGNINSSPESFTWAVDTEPPTTTIDSSTDGYKREVSNGGNTVSNSIIFTFSAIDTGGKEGNGVGIKQLECKMDSLDFASCTSPLQLKNLSDGAHTLEVMSEDNAGNISPTPVSFSWNIDKVPPTTTITSAVDGNESSIANASNTRFKAITFTFVGNDTDGNEGKGLGIRKFDCSIDGSNFTTCTSPVQLAPTNITDGTHTFKVSSQDNVGNNDPSPASFNWMVDTIAPTTTINTAIDGNKTAITNGSNTKSNSIAFKFSGNDTGVGISNFECSVDNSNFTTCTSPIQFTSVNLGDGTHTFRVLSEDNSTNKDPSPASFTWTVDTAPPNTTLVSAINGNGTALRTGDNTTSNSMTFAFSANDTGGKEGIGVGINHFECNIDNSKYVPCTSPFTFPKLLNDGTHTFNVLSIDNSRNKDPSPASFSWGVDTVPPTTTINTAIDGNKSAITNGSNTKSNSVVFKFSGNDTGGAGVDHLECSLDAASFTTCTSPVQLTPTNLLDGSHTFMVIAQDKVGNIRTTPALFNWTVDTIPATTTINTVIDSNNKTLINDGSTKSTSMTATFTGNDAGVGVSNFECSIDNSNFTTCTSPVQSNNLTDGIHTLKILSDDKVGNKASTPSSFNWTIDTESPSTSIFSATDGSNKSMTPGSNTSSNSVAFEFSANDTGGTEDKGVGIKQFECSIDNSNFTTCTSPVRLSSDTLKDGNHIFKIRAEDNVGNMNLTPASFSWMVDTIAPTTTINTAIDGNKTAITNGSNTKSNSIAFKFSGNDTGVGISNFECSVDNSNFTTCTSPIQFTSVNLGDGTHTFRVLSEDNSTNKDPSPSSFTWTVDTAPPNTTLVSAINGNGTALRTGDNTTSNSMTFAFSANDTGGKEGIGVGINHFECNIDNSKFVTCTSPFTFPKLLNDGTHTFNVLSVDNSSNKDPSPASFNWMVDTIAPTTTINTAIDGNKTAITNGSNTKSNSVVFKFSGNDTGVGISNFECSVDNSNFTTCTSPVQSNNLTDGAHNFKVSAKDNVKNLDLSPESISWTVDTVAPLTSINSAFDGNKSAISTGGNTSSNNVIFSFSGTDSGVGLNHFECSIDNLKFVTCTSPLQIDSLRDGVHTLVARAHDGVGNKDLSPTSFNWTIDTESPSTSIFSATDGSNKSMTPGSNTSSNSVAFEFSANDTGGTEDKGVGIKQFECSIDNSNFTTCTSPVGLSSDTLKDGNHIFKIRAEDNVGNMNLTPASFSWMVDTIAPTTTINTAIDGNKTAITNGSNTKSNSIAFKFSGNDTGVGISNFECSVDNSNFTTCTSPIQFTSVNLGDGTHTFRVLSEDNSTNKDPSPASFTWTVDTAPPNTTLVSAINGNGTALRTGDNTSSNSMTFAFSANDTGGSEGKGVGINHFECNIDNSKFVTCTSPFTFPKLLNDGTHTFNVLSIDNSRNKDTSPSSFNWMVDTIAPTATINTAIDGNKSAITNGSNTKSNSVVFKFSGNDTGGAGVDHLECSLDAASFTTCTSPVQLTPTNLLDGSHTFMVIAQDKVGNIRTTPALFNWTVDTIPATTTINTVIDSNNKTLINDGSTKSTSMTATFTGNDAGVGVSNFECSIDNSNFTTCTSPVQSNNLTDGIHTLKILSDDKVGNKASTPSSFNWTIDTESPSTSIFSATDGSNKSMTPGSNTSSNSVAFEFSANDTGGTEDKGVGIKQFECSIDNSNFTTCTSPVGLSSDTLKDGNHIFKIRAEDNVGNMNLTPASFSWMVDTIAPTTTINTAIDGNKSAITNGSNTKSNSIAFKFSGNDTGVGISNFECSVDNSNFTTCTSPVQSNNLTDGAHNFKVSAKDNVKNLDLSPESISWTVDTVAPLTSINSAFDGNKSAISTGGNTSSNNVIFSFSGTDSGVGLNHFECSIDNLKFVTCTSPLQIDSLRDGVHTLVARAHDGVGNKDLSPASFSWTVDTVAPLTSINSAFDGNKSAISTGGNTSSNYAIFAFSATDTGGKEDKGVGINHFECILDNSNTITCTSPLEINSLKEGNHNLQIFSKDNVGNMKSSPASLSWNVDTIPPTTSITSANDGNNQTINNNDNSSSTSIKFTFTGNDSGGIRVTHLECSLDGGPFSICTSPIQYSSANISDGAHIFDVRAQDNVGNKDPSPSSFAWTVDTVPPDANIDSATDGNRTGISNGGNTSSNSVTFKFSGNDTGGKEGIGVGINHFECSIDNSNFTTCTSPVQSNNLTDGAHIFEVRAEDNVGNISPSPSSFTWTVDTTPPATSINSATDGNKSAVTNGNNTKSTSMTFMFSGNDTGVGISNFECSIDNSNFTTCTSPVQSNNLTNGAHNFKVSAKDHVGNISPSPSSFTWTVDTIPPSTTIDSATDSHHEKIVMGGNSSANSILFEFAGNDTGVGVDHFECSIDNLKFVTCASPLEIDSLKDGTHTLAVLSEDTSTNKDLSPALFRWTVDTTPPTTIINSIVDVNQSSVTNGGSTKSTSMTFAFSGTDTGGVGIDHFDCSIDNSNFVTCSNPVQFNSLKDGAHILQIRAEDNVRNIDPSSSSFTWNVDTTPPATSINSATDGNKSAVTNGGTTKSTSMIFGFSGTDTGGVGHFECSIDNSNFTICTSPIQFTSVNLGDGTHTFRVLSEDNSTNKDPSPSSFTWTVDTVPPNTTLVSAINGNGTALRTGDNTTSNSMTFAFSANDTGGNQGKGVGINHFECNIDNSKFVTCTSPFTFPKLLNDGTHTFNVLSIDNSRNKDTSPSSFTWTVDTKPPATSINSATDGNKSAVTNGGTTKSTSMTFAFSANDTGGVGIDHFECNVDGLTFVTCTSPFTFPSLSEDGQYTLEIRAQDRVGNKDPSPASFTWTVDTSPPATTIDSATDGNNRVITAGGNTSSNSMIFLFSSIDSGVGVDHSECSIDNSKFTVCTSPLQFTSTNLGDGIHTLKILSDDKVGNKASAPSSFNWTVDTAPPTTSIKSATDGNKSAVTNAGTTKSTSMTFAFSGNDSGGIGIDHFECSTDNSDFVTCTSPFTLPNSLKDGTHAFRVLSEDKVGNRGSSPASFNWTVDTVPSTTTINSATDGNKSAITNTGTTKSTSMTFAFSGNDTGGIGIDHFECSIDNSDFVTCTSPFTFANLLKDGTHTFRVLSEDKVGNRGSSPALFNWTVDTVPPSTTIDSVIDGNKSSIITGGNSSSNSAIITFSGIDTGGNQGKGAGINHFDCSLDGASFSTCSAPLELKVLKDGAHMIEIKASDNVGNNDSTPSSFSWTIDTAPPTTTITSAIDGNRKTVTAGGNTTSTSMTFAFSGTDRGSGVNHFECSVDGASFAVCTSPVEYTNLADGSHTLEVRAKDNVANVDASPASFAWSIDTIPPTTSINSVVDSNKNTLSNGSNTRSSSITFSFSGSDTSKVEVKRFQCSLDNSDFADCRSPLTFPNLSDGPHAFKVRALDNSGNNDNSPELFTWKVDTTPPSSNISTAFDGKNDTVTNGGNTTSRSMMFTFSGSDRGVGVDHFECSLDGASFTTCTSPEQFKSLSDRSHNLEVLSEDKAGNRGSSPASFNWTVDTVPPTTTIKSATDGNKSAVTNAGTTKSTSMTFAFSGNDTGGIGIDHFECSTDNSDFVTCTSPFTLPNSLKDGTHAFRVLSEDKAGNRGSSPASFNWTVDTVPAKTTINSATDGNKSAVTNAGTTKSTSMTFAFSGNDTGGIGIDHFECSTDNSDFVTCTSPFTLPNSLKDGTHAFRVLSEDKAGNRGSSPASFNWTVDTAPPTTSITSAIDGNRNTVTTGGNTTSTSMTFAFSGTDRGTGVNHFECSVDGASFTTCTSPIQFNNLSDGAHTLEVRAEDNVANIDASPASFAWTIDTIPPTTSINSVVDSNKNTLSNGSNTRSSSITFSFLGSDTSKVKTSKVEVKRFQCSLDKSDFADCRSPLTFPNLLSNGPHAFKVRALDNSGNNDNSPELFTWNVDATPPDTTINSANDGNNKTVSNGGNGTSRSMTFTFTGSDVGVGVDHFECSIDGASFASCTSPIQFSNLADGSHTLEVRAEDKAGNEGPTPTAFIWTINTTPPNTTINSVTDGNKNTVANNSNSKSNIVTIAFSAIDAVANVDHFECSIDNSGFADCTSPFRIPNLLSDGPHTIKVRAVDNSGHGDPSPALYTWTVDTSAPTTNITSATDGNKNPISADGGTSSTAMIFTFSGNDTGVGLDHFECSIDGASFTTCASPNQLNDLGNGAHKLLVRAVDNVGNQGTTPASFGWNVDVTPPDTTINSSNDGNNKTVTSGSNTTSRTMTFTFSGSDIGMGLDHFECSIEGASFSTCDTPLQFTDLSIGDHSFEVRAEDKVGNKGQMPTVFLWTITSPPPAPTPPPSTQNITTPSTQNITTPSTQNITTPSTQNITTPSTQNITTPPPPIPQNVTTNRSIGGNENIATNETTKIPATGVALDTKVVSAIDGAGKAVANDGTTPSSSIVFVLSASIAGIENGGAGIKSFECSIDGSSFSACTSPVQYSGLADGAHILEARSIDNSGNKDPSPASFTWTVDTVPPDTIINTAIDGNNRTLTDGSETESTNVTFTFSGNDTSVEEGEEVGINHFECSIDGSSFATCTSPVQYDNLGNGRHILEIMTVDNSGNKDPTPSSFTWSVNTARETGNIVNNITGAPSPTTSLQDTVINSTTDGSSNVINNETSTASSTIRFDFSTINAKGVDHFECSMDSSEFVICTSPFIFPNLSQGKHVFMVRFVDVNGNKDESPAAFVWEINR